MKDIEIPAKLGPVRRLFSNQLQAAVNAAIQVQDECEQEEIQPQILNLLRKTYSDRQIATCLESICRSAFDTMLSSPSAQKLAEK
jgi:hypothetical protein